MNLDELKIEQTEVILTENEFKRKQIRLIAALLDIESGLRQKEAELTEVTMVSKFKEAA